MKGDFEVNNKNTLGKKMILVEQDAGFISPNDERNKQFINEVNGFGKSSEQIMVEPLVLYVVLQIFCCSVQASFKHDTILSSSRMLASSETISASRC